MMTNYTFYNVTGNPLGDFVGSIFNGQNATFNGTATPVLGVQGTFGATDFIGLAGVLIIIMVCVIKKATPDLTIMATMTMINVLTLSGNITTGYQWLFIIGGGVVFGLGLIKVLKIR